MRKYLKMYIILSMFTSLSMFIVSFLSCTGSSQKLDDFKYQNTYHSQLNQVRSEFQFNGYTNYWHDIYREWIHYGNLFKIAIPNLEYTIAQSKVDIAEDMGIPGLYFQEGFLDGLIKESYISLDQPSIQHLEESLKRNNVLALLDPDSEAGKELVRKSPGYASLKEKLKSHQFNTTDFIEVNAFILENNKRKLFVISSLSKEPRNLVKVLLDSTMELLKVYDMHRGWFGVKTPFKSTAGKPGQPLGVIGKGMNEGNDWFIFDGYFGKKDLEEWLSMVKLPIVIDIGYSPIFGCKDYDGLQVQNMLTRDSWVDYAHKKGGYVFRPVFDTLADPYRYDGYLATDSRSQVRGGSLQANEGNKEQIDNEDIPFISLTGNFDSDAIPSMVVFINKDEQLTDQLLWESILSRREVAVLDQGKMMGPSLYRNSLEMLLLDRVFLEEYFGDRINIDVNIMDDQLNVTVTNTYSHKVLGTLDLELPANLQVTGSVSTSLKLTANSSKTLVFKIQPKSDTINKVTPIAVHYNWGTSKKSTLTVWN